MSSRVIKNVKPSRSIEGSNPSNARRRLGNFVYSTLPVCLAYTIVNSAVTVTVNPKYGLPVLLGMVRI